MGSEFKLMFITLIFSISIFVQRDNNMWGEKLVNAKNMYGTHMAMRLATERQQFTRPHRLFGLPSSRFVTYTHTHTHTHMPNCLYAYIPGCLLFCFLMSRLHEVIASFMAHCILMLCSGRAESVVVAAATTAESDWTQ